MVDRDLIDELYRLWLTYGDKHDLAVWYDAVTENGEELPWTLARAYLDRADHAHCLAPVGKSLIECVDHLAKYTMLFSGFPPELFAHRVAYTLLKRVERVVDGAYTMIIGISVGEFTHQIVWDGSKHTRWDGMQESVELLYWPPEYSRHDRDGGWREGWWFNARINNGPTRATKFSRPTPLPRKVK